MSNLSKRGVDRRRVISAAGAGLAAGALTPQTQAQPQLPAGAVTIREGTNIAVAPSPDGRTLAFDLLGVIWTLPIDGGAARRVTDDLADAAQPDWTPDSRRLVFQAYRDGVFQVCSVGADGSGFVQHTRGPFDCREPRVSPDGRRVAYASDQSGSYAIHVLDLASGQSRLWARPDGQAAEPAWSPDGRRIAYAVDRTRIEVADEAGAVSPGPKVTPSADRFNPAELRSPAFTPDGGDIVYWTLRNGRTELRGATGPVASGGDIFPFRATWLAGGELIYAADGKILRRGRSGEARSIPFSAAVPVKTADYRKPLRDYDGAGRRPVVGIGSPALSPDGRQVVFRALNGLYLLDIGDKARPLVNDGFWTCDPAWSPDGRSLAYSTDRGGKLDIWVRDMASGAERQLTRHKDAAVSGAWSRDGRAIAFLDQNGSLHVVEVASGQVRQVFGALWEPGRPSWSADGKTIAMAAFKPYAARYREGLSEILTVDVASGQGTYEPVLPHRSLVTRGDDGPAFSPDGARLAFVFASRLYVAPVDARGKLAGTPVALNNEVTDAPSWSGDGRQILYLSNGALRLIPAAGGAPRTVPHGLTWAAARPRERKVVRGGRVWDGKGAQVRSGVDVVIEGNRIADLLPAGSAVAGAQVVDASGATVIPGLMDMHTHRQMQGYAYGDREGRLWLSLGVTTTRSPGSPAYHMVEDREALDAGTRVGPRYFATGEAVDGGRIFYNFMRPVTEPGQLELELARAKALGYDLIKTYVRLPFESQRRVIEWAHSEGMPVTSHYHYPSLAFGQDGMEHIGATTRLGYPRTVSATGASYEDVTALFNAAGARRTPTLFQSSALYGTDRSLVDDPRTRALYPPWEYARLVQRADQLKGADASAALAVLERNVAHLRALMAGGAQVIAGTDSPIDFNGLSLHMNLRGMVRYGVAPHEALMCATSIPGEYLGQPLGVIAKGMLADLVVCEGDPLQRIEDAAAVRRVIKNGEVFDMARILGPFGGAANAQAEPPTPAIQLAAQSGPTPFWHEAEWVADSRAACCVDAVCRQPHGRRIYRAVEV
ncbi:LpqB family beta-propeller domain-containing protein [Phenylobacterium deserti]|uniref:Amidohydrolase n=1 Tax=Phenylobacterium deserti TaxID=1914756 RepID=A0A328AC79_9CAUL|nr:LpqB family beta-propeller domain-containing protein [Phenylobacterium deserti]RAK52215.1 amidohydrolase [Phenylobacterium deserti]